MSKLTTTVVAIFVVLGATASASNDPFLGYDGPVFPNPVISTLGNEPWGMLEGDFNEDGIEDLAVIGASGLVIALGNGDCTFDRAYLPHFGHGSGALGDFNEDNHQDLVFGTTGDNALVLLGNGDGTFGSPISLAVPGGSFSIGVAVADFNENNHEDIVVGFFDSRPFGYFAGNGDGTFAPVSTFALDDIFDLDVADFDENGDLDFIAGTTTPKVYLGGGNGTFAMGGTYPVGTDPLSLLIADFDGDTHADFASANWLSDDVSVRLGNGDGTFGPETLNTAGGQPRFLALADVDGGDDDLLVGSLSGAYVSLLSGNGDGTFDPEIQIPTVATSGPIVVVDFDDDGRLDLAVASQAKDEVSVLRGHGDGTFVGPDPALVDSSGPSATLRGAAFADVDKDGLSDVVRLVDLGATSISVLVADGTGGFTVSATDAAGVGPSDIAVADVDNDTNLDVIATNFDSNTASILLGNGDGTFDLGYSVPVSRDPVSLVTGLFNADANEDLAVLTTALGEGIRMQLGDGNGAFSPGGTFFVGPGAGNVEKGDFDEDGEIDLVVMNFGSTDLSILHGVGDGTFDPEVRYGPIQVVGATVTVTDVDGDGHEDLLLGSEVLYGAGDGTFGSAIALDPEAFSEQAGDVNGDGRPDLVGVTISQVNVQLGEAGGSFSDPTYFSGASTPNRTFLEDTDGDGRLDVIVATSSGVSALLNVEPSPFNFSNDKVTLRWPDVDGALSYNIYRGLLSTLNDGNNDGLPDAGYGTCQNALDPDTTDLVYADASVPAVGDGYYYLIAVEDWAGERWLGETSGGLMRAPALSCP